MTYVFAHFAFVLARRNLEVGGGVHASTKPGRGRKNGEVNKGKKALKAW